MRYIGLQPLDPNVPLIELEAANGEVVDLYNDCALQSVVIDSAGLSFKFVSSEHRCVAVDFHAVRNLRVEQPRDWVSDESAQIEHLLIREEGPWPKVAFTAGGLHYEFDCDALRLILTDG